MCEGRAAAAAHEALHGLTVDVIVIVVVVGDVNVADDGIVIEKT